jgi:hypothetical protein
MPSAIQSTGRTVCVRYSRKRQGWVVGGDVATLSIWSDRYGTFRNVGAGTGWTGTDLQPFAHKAPVYCDNGTNEGLLSGSNGDGLIYVRGTGNWIPVTSNYHGEVNEGGSSLPRTAGHLLGLVDPDLDSRWFMGVLLAGGAGRGIVRSTDSGVSYTDWSTADDCNYTGLVKSSLWPVIYASADDKGGGTGGVFALVGLGSGTATRQQLDTIGSNKPSGGIPDARGFPATPEQRAILAPSPPTGSTTANIPPPRMVTTGPEAAARIAGYIFGDGNEDHLDTTLGGTALTYLANAALNTPAMKDEFLRCCAALGWTAGVQYRVPNSGNPVVLKSALTTALGAPSTANLYFRGLLDMSPSRVMVQAWLASVIETEGNAGFAPDCKIMDDARGGLFDQRIDATVAMMNLSAIGPGGSFRQSISCRVAVSNLDTYAIPLVVTGRYPGNTLAPWPESAPGAPPSGDPGDYLYCYVGTGANAGVWECVVTKDRSLGALVDADVTWRRILTFSAGDEAQCGVARQPSGPGTLPIQLYSFQYASTSNSSGTYVLTAAAGGATRNYRKGALRCMDATVTPTPTWEILGGANVNMNMYGVPYTFPHPVTFMGEAAAENGRFLGSNWGAQDADMSPDSSTIVIVGKTSPYRCDNPWVADPTTIVFQPFSQGLGVLSGGWDIALAPVDGNAIACDDDRGFYAFQDLWRHPILATAIGSDDLLGISISPNACASVEPSVVTPTTMLLGHATGVGFAASSEFTVPPTAITLAKDFSATSATNCIGFYDLLDGASALRYLGVLIGAGIVRSAAGGGTPNTTVSAFTSVAERSILARSGGGQYLWLCVPDKGIYRSTDYGATWSLWWNHAIAGEGSRWFGFLAQDHFDPDALWVTFDDGGVWRITGARTAASSAAKKVVGGDLAGTEIMGLVIVDQLWGTVTAFRAINGDGEQARVYRLANGTVSDAGSTYTGIWIEDVDEEIAEGGQLVVAGIAHGRKVAAAASGQGVLRRV